MSILVGHPSGNPNSHNAALAYLEAGLLECFCVPWIPSATTIEMLTIEMLKSIRPLRPLAQRLERRQFPPLAHARECRRSAVTAVHAYEDCSLTQFVEAKRLGKACIYDMPTCYYPEWERIRVELGRTYSEWIPSQRSRVVHEMRLKQKRQEMALADLTFVASRYVEVTIREFYPHKNIARIPYGVDGEFWTPAASNEQPEPLRFIYAGNVSVRKGMPLQIEARSKAGLRDAELALVGSWGLADSKRRSLPH
jgi:glycosyltransferase involved in cell wall biosynthesis